MKNKKVMSLLFFFIFSYGYSNVNYTISYTEDHSQKMDTGNLPITIYQPHINITRTSNNEAVDLKIFSERLYSMSSQNWIKFTIKPNLIDLVKNHISLKMTNLYLNGTSIPITRQGTNIVITNTWNPSPSKNLTTDFNIIISPNTPDFHGITLGSFVQTGRSSIPIRMGTISLVTLHPLTVDVPDIDFGDVIVTSGNQTKSGQITVTGSVNTKVSFDIPTHNFKLYKIGNNNGISASVDIDGRILKYEDTIRSNGNLTKNLNVTISNFSNLPPGRYEGDLIINIDSN